MKKTKSILIKSLLVLFLFVSYTNTYGQEITKYDYAEIIVVQKSKKKVQDLKRVYLNSTTENSLDAAEIMKVTKTTDLLKYMNDHNWEFVNRIGTQPSLSEPIWLNYIFRKKK